MLITVYNYYIVIIDILKKISKTKINYAINYYSNELTIKYYK